MSVIRFRNNIGQWVDPCGSPIKLFHPTNGWSLIKNLDRVFDGTQFRYIVCGNTINASVRVSSVTYSNDFAFGVGYYHKGIPVDLAVIEQPDPVPILVDPGLAVIIQWNTSVYDMRLNGELLFDSPHSFIPTQSFSITAATRQENIEPVLQP